MDDAGPDPVAAEEPAEDDRPIAEPLPTVDQLLEGITLTHDLVPLTARIEDPDRHAIFISSHPEPAEVGTAFADELATRGSTSNRPDSIRRWPPGMAIC